MPNITLYLNREQYGKFLSTVDKNEEKVKEARKKATEALMEGLE